MFSPAKREEALGRLYVPLDEYLLWRQPNLFWLYDEYGLSREPMTRDAMKPKAQLRESHVFGWWKRIMEEQPGYRERGGF